MALTSIGISSMRIMALGLLWAFMPVSWAQTWEAVIFPDRFNLDQSYRMAGFDSLEQCHTCAFEHLIAEGIEIVGAYECSERPTTDRAADVPVPGS